MPNLEFHLQIDGCPHCGVNSPNLTAQHTMQTTGRVGLKTRYWKVYECQRCGGLVTAASNTGNGAIAEMYPSRTEVDQAIPQAARDYLSQAISSIHAPAGAVMLTASAVDAMLKAKNYKDGSLYTRINQAATDFLITNDMGKWAHEIRLDANDQRHADEGAALPSESDARKCVEFALALAQFLFVLPSRVERGLEQASS